MVAEQEHFRCKYMIVCERRLRTFFGYFLSAIVGYVLFLDMVFECHRWLVTFCVCLCKKIQVHDGV